MNSRKSLDIKCTQFFISWSRRTSLIIEFVPIKSCSIIFIISFNLSDPMTSTVKEVALHTVKGTSSQIYTHTELSGNVSVAVVLISIVTMYTVNLIGSIKHDILNIKLEVPEVKPKKHMTIKHVMKCITKNDM